MFSSTHLAFALLLSFILVSHGFILNSHPRPRTLAIKMGLADMLKNAMANDPNLPPAQNAGLSSSKTPVEVEFFPSGIKVKAYLGQDIKQIAKAAKVQIPYKCQKGDCGTCKINFEGSIVKACQSSLPSSSKKTKFTIGIIPKA